MLISGICLKNLKILSLHVGAPIASITEDIVDPNNLNLIAFKLAGGESGGENGTILETRDIRESSSFGLIVDSSDVFVNDGDVIKLDKILALNFSLIGLKVETKSGKKLGRVIDYVVETTTFKVVQIIVRPFSFKSFIEPELVIDRCEIIEVNDYKVIIKDEKKTIKEKKKKEEFVPNFVNPFREPDFAEKSA